MGAEREREREEGRGSEYGAGGGWCGDGSRHAM